jgi:hypothetical protein
MLTVPQRVVLISHGSFAEDGPRPQVLMAYEDLNMALRAMNVLALIAKEAGEVVELQFAMWRFACFETRELREAAARQAVQADVIVVAPGNSGGGLSAPVTSWLEQWTGCRQLQPGALVAVLDPSAEQHDGESVAVCQLRSAARVTGMDFFCGALQQVELPSGHGHPCRTADPDGIAHRSPSTSSSPASVSL